mgnify:CR=1 FL=1
MVVSNASYALCLDVNLNIIDVVSLINMIISDRCDELMVPLILVHFVITQNKTSKTSVFTTAIPAMYVIARLLVFASNFHGN